MKQTSERTAAIERISSLISIYANDDQTIRELERVVIGWLAMKRKLRMKRGS